VCASTCVSVCVAVCVPVCVPVCVGKVAATGEANLLLPAVKVNKTL
jgi:hypothetical protein